MGFIKNWGRSIAENTGEHAATLAAGVIIQRCFNVTNKVANATKFVPGVPQMRDRYKAEMEERALSKQQAKNLNEFIKAELEDRKADRQRMNNLDKLVNEALGGKNAK
jgi:hypothetical protein